jgi:hypothetical protein
MMRRWLVIAILAGSVGGASAAAELELVTGMPLQTALELLHKSRIKAIEDEGDYEALPGAKEQRRYYVRPTGSQDALYFVAARKANEPSLKLTAIFWWKDWVHDSKQPKGQRQNREIKIRTIALKSLK